MALAAKLRRYPVTCAAIATAALLFALSRAGGGDMRAWGHGTTEDYWSGEVWRLVVNAFHHGSPHTLWFSLVHLAFNLYFVWWFGRAAEEVFKSAAFGAFLLGCILFSGLACELTIEPGAVGLSGVVYGMLGWLYATRLRDHRIQDALDPTLVQGLVVWLFLCVALTHFGVLPVANVGHFSGLAYGWAFGRVLYPIHRKPPWRKAAFWAAHVLLAAGLLVAVFPFHNARWHLWRAMRVEGADRIERLERALILEPSFVEARYELALALAEQGKVQEAVDHLEILENSDPSDPLYPQAAVYILRRAGEEKKAKVHQERLDRARAPRPGGLKH